MCLFFLVNIVYIYIILIYNYYKNKGIDGMREPILYRIVRPIITGLFLIVFRPKIIGRNRIPTKGRIILAGNHTNYLDCILLISCTKRTIHFLAKEELLSSPIGFIFKGMGIIPVNRKIHDKMALSKGIEALNCDKVIGIFPEGTINKTKDIILPFKIGAVKMASVSGSKIIPFTIVGKYRLFNSKLRIEFFDEMEVVPLDDLSSYNKKLENIISESLRKEK